MDETNATRKQEAIGKNAFTHSSAEHFGSNCFFFDVACRTTRQVTVELAPILPENRQFALLANRGARDA